jgi:hypothetical protein
MRGMGERRHANKRGEATWKSRHRWENNIKIDVKEIGWEGMDWFKVGSSDLEFPGWLTDC